MLVNIGKNLQGIGGIILLKYLIKNLEQDSINPILYNPKELFKEFIDEIEKHNISKSK